jgi:hypothetical protein
MIRSVTANFFRFTPLLEVVRGPYDAANRILERFPNGNYPTQS